MKILPISFQSGDRKQWFHPGFSPLQNGRTLLTKQEISGADYYGEPAFSISGCGMENFSVPQKIPAFINRKRQEHLIEGVADIRPFDLGNGHTAVLGCTTFYCDKGNAEWERSAGKTVPQNEPVVCFLRPDGNWSELFYLDVDGLTAGYRTACSQITATPDGCWIIPFYAEIPGKTCEIFGCKSVCFCAITAKYRFDGEKFVFLEKGNVLENPVGRGFCEPSVMLSNREEYFLTLRAEDGHGYAAHSSDGLNWSTPVAWHWSDGSEIEMSSTQQHYVKLGNKIFLVYTRKDEGNQHIFRFRAPLFIAEADPFCGILKRETEQIVFDRQQKNGEEAWFGNFHVTQLSGERAWIADSALFSKQKIAMPLLAEITD